jgi:integrase
MAAKVLTAKVVPFAARDPAEKPPMKKARRSLTDAYLRAIKPPAKGRLEVRDSDVAGLVLRMTPKGTAAWSVRVLGRDGKHQRPTLGTWPALGIRDARKAAQGAIAAIQAGGDPVADKQAARAQRQAKSEERSVTERLAEWQEAKCADGKSPWSDRYAAEVARIARREIEPKIGKRLLKETSRADWTGLVSAKRKVAPAMASSMFRIVASFLSYAEAQGWIAAPLLPRKGAAMLAPAPEPRQRALTDGEITEVWQAAGKEPPKLRAFLRVLILTACRAMEAADVAWGELDLDAGRWSIPATRTKNGNAITLPLCALAVSELRAALPENEIGAGYRLFGRNRGSGLRGFSKLKARVDHRIAALRAQAGVTDAMPPWRFHDLRRTARTGMARLGVPREHAEAAVNHISARSTLERTYDRHDYAPEIAMALGKWQMHVSELVKVEPLPGEQLWGAARRETHTHRGAPNRSCPGRADNSR